MKIRINKNNHGMRKTRLFFVYALSWLLVALWVIKIDRHSLPDISGMSTALTVALLMPFITALPAFITGQRIDVSSLFKNDIFKIRPPFVYNLKKYSETIRVFSKGNSLFPILLIYGDFDKLPEEEKRAVMAHESLHIRFWHTPVCMFFFVAITISLRDPMLAAAISSTLSRYFEYKADHFAASITSPETVISTLNSIKPDKNLEKLTFVPVINLLLPHPPASLRVKRLEQTVAD